MASRSFSEEDFSCAVCRDIYKDPVILTCSHSVCKVCLQRFWETKLSRECPVCRSVTSTEHVCPPNLALRNLCEIFLQRSQTAAADSDVLCHRHNEKRKLFCLEDKQPVCLVCRDSKKHRGHTFSPIDEAAQERKEELGIKLQLLQKKLEDFNLATITCDKTLEYIKVQTQHTEMQIKEEFEKLHQFLQDEEAARIAALREEEEQKSQMVKEKMEKISREISFLSDTITTIEEEMGADDITLLQSYNRTVARTQSTLQYPEGVSGALINVAKHLGNLKFRVWEKMQEIVQLIPVTLDPNTAHPQLILSEDLTSMNFSYSKQQLPDNPERFDYWVNVLGSEGFNSGTHCWDVEVGDIHLWAVGVMSESAKRKGPVCEWSGLWFLLHERGEYDAFSSPLPESWFEEFLATRPSRPSPITVSRKPQRIRVQLDWDKGEMSFYDSDDNTHLHTITHTFTERVFPFFGAQSQHIPLKILPLKLESISDRVSGLQ
ncbi:zinc-binding protein A33-like isoform X2 [Alosa sapidissima]|uniref:zinc-binding protein A33-like isoform X2 n=1 Tax=Alosa sapidissima TaxID=34773 RepID=UPI001C088F98|nr:zinc-binding protein A33-like isoform X2 [Alosa sapidissima]